MCARHSFVRYTTMQLQKHFNTFTLYIGQHYGDSMSTFFNANVYHVT
jgi:ABC-type transporter MlaC component